MSPAQEEAVLVRCIDLIEQVSGQTPRGYVAPWWEMSGSTAALLLKYGSSTTIARVITTSSRSTPASATKWTKIDYSRSAERLDAAA